MGRIKAKKVFSYFLRANKPGRDLNYEDILFYSIGAKRSLFRLLLEFFKKNNIKITSENGEIIPYGNIANGGAIIESASNGYTRILEVLLGNGGTASIRDNMPLLVSIKNAHYTCSLMLLRNGADIHSKNDLPYKTFLRNEDRRICPKGEELSHNKLLSMFKENKCVSGREKVNNGE